MQSQFESRRIFAISWFSDLLLKILFRTLRQYAWNVNGEKWIHLSLSLRADSTKFFFLLKRETNANIRSTITHKDEEIRTQALSDAPCAAFYNCIYGLIKTFIDHHCILNAVDCLELCVCAREGLDASDKDSIQLSVYIIISTELRCKTSL